MCTWIVQLHVIIVSLVGDQSSLVFGELDRAIATLFRIAAGETWHACVWWVPDMPVYDEKSGWVDWAIGVYVFSFVILVPSPAYALTLRSRGLVRCYTRQRFSYFMCPHISYLCVLISHTRPRLPLRSLGRFIIAHVCVHVLCARECACVRESVPCMCVCVWVSFVCEWVCVFSKITEYCAPVVLKIMSTMSPVGPDQVKKVINPLLCLAMPD